MLLRGIEWKGFNILAGDELSHRKELTASNLDENDILQRPWF